jgi:hypothetical protein
MHNGPSKYKPYTEYAQGSDKTYRTAYVILQRKKGTTRWAYYVKWWQLWKIVEYGYKLRAIAHARLLKRTNLVMEFIQVNVAS